MSRYDWMSDALCTQVDPEIFFPENGRYDEAKKICADCPVRAQCDTYAQAGERGLSYAYRHGAWAGKPPRGRAHTNDVGFHKERAENILRLAAANWDAKQIAAELNCTTRTVWRTLADHRRTLGEAA